MDTINPEFSELFAQLGLPDDAESIDKFITTHSPLDPDTKLVDAPFWTDSQRKFLKDAYNEDADQWIMLIDQLNVILHSEK
ncbi:DUF2789 domain-containing protein [Pseudomonas capeferrum]|uniref:DUF2789 domain-containing protein n=1 Tax=Pseudomonas capeferrum TaxID=1495066 RepID=UPI0015E41F52|nr:DUF2789 domain-containing protein [Pseudomonas capeferrum]MBA1202220.1 DUF2789 domain-containing protein [Pseudomonas capeferrum]